MFKSNESRGIKANPNSRKKLEEDFRTEKHEED